MKTEICNVSPAMAVEWLRLNTVNRKLRRSHVESIISDLRSGGWKLTHQGIAFSEDGGLLDGQHRLTAIAESGISARMMVTRGVPKDGYDMFDRGASRSMRDILRMENSIVDPCCFIARLANYAITRTPTPVEVDRVYHAISLDIAAIQDSCSAKVRGRTAAPIKAALAIRHHMASPLYQDLLMRQWKAFVTLDVVNMDKTSGAFLRRIDSIAVTGGGTLAMERFAIGWISWDPKRRNLEKIIVRDRSSQISEARKIISDIVPSA